MSPENLAQNLARVEQVYKEYKILHPAQIFNLDESGFSTRTGTRARPEAVMRTNARGNAIQINWNGNA